jgi:hypothetical protein
MSKSRSLVLCTCAFTLISLFCAGGSSAAQSNSDGQQGQPASAGSAFVYVSSPEVAGEGTNEIEGWSVARDGSLTPVPGSPYATPEEIALITSSPRFLFGDMLSDGNQSIGSWAIAPNGALTLATTTAAHAGPNPIDIYNDGTTSDFTDRSGTTLYDTAQAYAIQPNGGLNWIGYIGVGNGYYVSDELSLTGNDRFAYTSDCQYGNQDFWAFTRSPNGALTYFNPNANVPVLNPNPEGTEYCPTYGAAVPAPDNRHVIFSLQVGNSPESYNGVNQLAVYTIDPANGQLSTSNTTAAMPQTTVGQATDSKFDPTGHWLAIAGPSGLELFGYNNGVLSGGNTILSTDSPSQIGWDYAGHLFAISQDSGSLYVFDVANDAATQAPGSPYTVPLYSYLAVHPMP